jgi:hypothetical protein
MPKIAEVKLSSCRLEVANFRKNCNCGHFFKKFWKWIVEVLPSSCGIAIEDSKNVARAHLCLKITPV